MDNNITPPDNSEGKKNQDRNNFRRRRPPRKPQIRDGGENSQNGSINVKPGRYDLPPEAAKSEAGSVKPQKPQKPQNPRPQKPRQNQIQDEKQATEQKSDYQANRNENHPAAQGQNPRRRSRNRRRNNRENREQNSVTSEELIEIAEEEKAINEYVAVTSRPDGEPSETEIIEELNSAENPGDVPGYDPEEAKEDETPMFFAEPEPEKPLATYEIIGVKFKSTGKIYYFDPDGHRYKREDQVIVDTARGLEFGTVDIGNRMVTEREVVTPLRKVVRRATPDDIARSEANAARAAEAFAICGEKIVEHKLDMKLVDVEYTFDNSKLLFYFTAEGRVDFRELVKDLAGIFRTRIELRQIGIRDETKLLGGIGICGRPFCCKTFLSDFVQVSIKMAKEQNLSLNSAKISGACGRLMCCLRYEYDAYAEEIKKTPRVDQIVTTPDGEGIVTEVQPLAGLCRVKFTDRTDMPPKVYHRDVLTVIGGKGVKKNPPAKAPDKQTPPQSEKSKNDRPKPAQNQAKSPKAQDDTMPQTVETPENVPVTLPAKDPRPIVIQTVVEETVTMESTVFTEENTDDTQSE